MERLDVHTMTKHIQDASTIEVLGKLRLRLHASFPLPLPFSIFSEMQVQLNHMHDAFIQRAIQLAETEMRNRFGSQNKKYAFIVFGSAGRSEQTLWSDQDNALIYDTDKQEDEIYFEQLSQIIFQNLFHLGYAPCSGNVLCNQSNWRGNLHYWSQILEKWLHEPEWEHVRYMLMFADARCVYGQNDLLYQCKKMFTQHIVAHPTYLQHMLRNTLYRKVSIGVLGQLIRQSHGPDAGGVDIKYGVYIPMVNGIRLLASQHHIHETSSIERIFRLSQLNAISADQADKWSQAFWMILYFRLHATFTHQNGIYESQGIIPASFLSKTRISEIKHCIRMGQEIMKFIELSIPHES